MLSRRWLFGLVLFSCANALSAGSVTTNRVSIVLRASSMVDVNGGSAINAPVVIIEGERIVAAGSGLPIPPGARVIDLAGTTLLPGLIDVHTHLLDDRPGDVDGKSAILMAVAQMSTAKRALLGAAMAREAVEAGFTTVRDVGNSGMNGDVALRDAIDARWVVGPRIIAATRAIAPVGGQFGPLIPEAAGVIQQEYAVISGVDDARRAARQALYDGADCLKVIVNAGTRLLSVEEIAAVVEEAHRAGRTVAAHATVDQAVRIAAEARVDSIEHAYTVSDETLAMMAERSIFLVPTDAQLETYVAMHFNGRRPTAEERADYEGLVKPGLEASRDRLRRAMKAGVRIAAGSDIYIRQPGRTRGEASRGMFRAYAGAGMAPLEIIRAATVNGAALLKRSKDLGALEKGKLADVIAVSGDPLKDVAALAEVRFVMKGGEIVRHDGASR